MFYLAFFFCLLQACKDAPQKGASNDDDVETHLDMEHQIDTLVRKYQDLDIFSGVVLMAKNGEPIYFKAFGLSDRESGNANTKNTLFDIGSMNKTFTGIVIRQLADEGKLALDDLLIDHIPDFTHPLAREISIRDLLDHRSGYGDYHSPGYFDLPLEQRSLQAIIQRAQTIVPDFPPGTDEQYSNLGYVILGGIIEAVTGQSYFDEVRRRIVDRIGLKNTYLNNFDALEERIAKGYFHTPLGELEEAAPIQDVPNPDGGFLSTAEDIMTFYRSYFYEDILLSQKAKTSDPYFEFLKNLPEGRATGAAGGFDGFNSVLLQVYSDDVTIIVLANMDEPVAERIGSDILSLYRGEAPEPPQLPAVQNVRMHFEKEGVEYVEDHFEELTRNFHPTDPKDLILNDLGYAYLYEAGDTETALEIFALNTRLFEEVANCWDSYGEALREAGEIEDAVAAYTRALELEPDLESSKMALDEIKN